MGKCLIVDGYNIINAWQELKSLAQDDLEFGREALIEKLSDCKGILWEDIIVVFDAYYNKNSKGSKEKVDGVWVIYTKEKETADKVIEAMVYDFTSEEKLEVATSDWLEQRLVMGKGALRLSARELVNRIKQHKHELRKDYINKVEYKNQRCSLVNNVDDNIFQKLENLRKRKGE